MSPVVHTWLWRKIHRRTIYRIVRAICEYVIRAIRERVVQNIRGRVVVNNRLHVTFSVRLRIISTIYELIVVHGVREHVVCKLIFRNLIIILNYLLIILRVILAARL